MIGCKEELERINASSTGNENSHEDQPNAKKMSSIELSFAMMSAALGTGIFNLPLRITQIGVLPFLGYIVLSSFFSYNGALIIVKLCKKFHFDSYGQMSQIAFGKVMKNLSQFVLVLFPWGITICFQVILVKFILQLGADVYNFGFYDNRAEQTYSSTGNNARMLLNILVILSNFLFIAKKQLGIIQKLTTVGIMIVAYNTLTIIYLMIFGFLRSSPPYLEYHGLTELDITKILWANFKGWQSFSLHVQALSSILFCYVNHQLVFFVLKNLENPTIENFQKTFRIVHIGESSIYLLIGLSGYFLLLEHADIEPIGAMVITSITPTSMMLGKSLMIFTLYFCIPLNMFPARQILYEALKIERTNKNNYMLSIYLAGSSCLIAIGFQNVNSYFGLLGGTAGVMMAGGIPVLCYIKLILLKQEKLPIKARQNFEQKQEEEIMGNQIYRDIVLIGIFGIVIMLSIAGAILSIVDPS